MRSPSPKSTTMTGEKGDPGPHFDWVKYLAGGGSAFLQVVVPYPIHKLMVRQVMEHENPSTRKAFTQLRSEGIIRLFRGLAPPLCQKATSNAIMFGSYASYASILSEIFPDWNWQLLKSIGAVLAGTSEAVLLTPFERIQTLLFDEKYYHHHQFKNTTHVSYFLFKHHGIKELYRGFSAIAMRNSFSTVAFFYAKEQAEALTPNFNSLESKFFRDFIYGGIIGATISSSISFPLNLVKLQMQVQVGGAFEKPWVVFQTVFDKKGREWLRVFNGVHLNFMRSLIAWGMANSTYELIHSLIKRSRKES